MPSVRRGGVIGATAPFPHNHFGAGAGTSDWSRSHPLSQPAVFRKARTASATCR